MTKLTLGRSLRLGDSIGNDDYSQASGLSSQFRMVSSVDLRMPSMQGIPLPPGQCTPDKVNEARNKDGGT